MSKENAITIIRHYGLRNQIRKFAEEAFELQEALIMAASGHGYISNVTEEIADVEVLLAQIKQLYNINQKTIDEIADYKIARQIERINKKE